MSKSRSHNVGLTKLQHKNHKLNLTRHFRLPDSTWPFHTRPLRILMSFLDVEKDTKLNSHIRYLLAENGSLSLSLSLSHTHTHKQLKKERVRYSLPTTGRLEKKRNRLELIITQSLNYHNLDQSTSHNIKPTKSRKPHLTGSNNPINPQLQQITTTLNNMEQTMKILTERIAILSFSDSKSQTTNNQSKAKTPIQNTDSTLHQHTTYLYQLQESNKQIEDILQKSEHSINQLNKSITEIHQLKAELTTWHNSLFYSEDSKIIKEIHQKLKTSELLSLPLTACNTLTPQLSDLYGKVQALEETFIECPCTSRSQINNALSNL